MKSSVTVLMLSLILVSAYVPSSIAAEMVNSKQSNAQGVSIGQNIESNNRAESVIDKANQSIDPGNLAREEVFVKPISIILPPAVQLYVRQLQREVSGLYVVEASRSKNDKGLYTIMIKTNPLVKKPTAHGALESVTFDINVPLKEVIGIWSEITINQKTIQAVYAGIKDKIDGSMLYRGMELLKKSGDRKTQQLSAVALLSKINVASVKNGATFASGASVHFSYQRVKWKVYLNSRGIITLEREGYDYIKM